MKNDVEQQEQDASSQYKSGFVTFVGKANVGKSTCINAILNQKITAVSPKPQTTRKRQLGILTLPNAQIILQDAPGIHQPRHKLGKYMLQQAIEALNDADVIIFMVDASRLPDEDDERAAQYLQNCKTPILLGLNKSDLLPPHVKLDDNAMTLKEFQSLVPLADPLYLSSLQPQSIQHLIEKILTLLPKHPPYFPEEQLTDWNEREIAAEFIREAALNSLRDEVPHGIAVRIDDYIERNEKTAYIAATIFCERESQKSIIIGKNGDMLKKIGSEARREIEEMSDKKVFLELRAKTQKNWRNNERVLKIFGYPIHKYEKVK